MRSKFINELINQQVVDVGKPVILYDMDGINSDMNIAINNLVSAGLYCDRPTIFHSLKANCFPPLLKNLAKAGCGASVSSLKEYQVAKFCGFKYICGTSPSFSKSDINAMVDDGVTVYLDGVNQLLSIGKDKNIAIRVKTDYSMFDVESSKSRLGVDLDNRYFFEIIEDNNLTITDVLIHHRNVKDSSDLEKLGNIVTRILNIFPTITNVNLGGGMTAIHKNPKEASLGWELLARSIRGIPERVLFRIEPGAQHMTSNGYLISSIVNIRENSESKCGQELIINASNWSLSGWAELELFSKSMVQQPNCNKVDSVIVGPSCFEDDVWVKDVKLPRLEVGDSLVFLNAGSYVASMNRKFCMLEDPEEKLIL